MDLADNEISRSGRILHTFVKMLLPMFAFPILSSREGATA